MRSFALLAGALGLSAWAALSARVTAQYDPYGLPELAVHSRAAVNDPRSHGVVGDRWLSLDEAILLTNKVLDENSLSKEELAQLSGFGNDIAWAEIDATVVPVLTLERNLTRIIDTPHGFTIAGANGTPTIVLGDTRGIVAVSDFVDFSNLKLRGGEYGIQVTHTDTLFGTLIQRVDFEGQSTGGVKVSFLEPGGNGRILMDRCAFRNLRTAVLVEDIGDARDTSLDLSAVGIRDCDVGFDVLLGSRGRFTMSMAQVTVTGGDEAMRVRRLASGQTRDCTVQGRYLWLEGGQSALSFDGQGAASNRLILQAVDLVSTTQALGLGPVGADLDLTLQDSRTWGDVRVAGGSQGKIQIDNLHIRNGNLDLGSSGAGATVSGSVLDNVVSLTVGTSPVTVRDSRFVGGTVQGTAAAPLSIIACHLAGTTIGSNVTVGQQLSDAQLGAFDASPLTPQVGTNLTLSTDLPPKLTGFYLLGPSLELPASLPGGLRVYFDLSQAVLLPGAVSGAQQVVLPIPNLPGLVGRDLFFHLAVTPTAGVTAPPLWLPPGRRIVLR